MKKGIEECKKRILNTKLRKDTHTHTQPHRYMYVCDDTFKLLYFYLLMIGSFIYIFLFLGSKEH